MKKNMRTGLILSLLLLFIGGCSFGGSETKEAKNNSSGNYLNVAIVSEPPSLDPATAKDNTSSAVVRNVFEGMTRITSENKVENAAAEKIDISEDGLTYTFTLRDSKWSNGDPLIAEDFEYAWKRALNPETLSEYASILYPIKGAEEYNKNGGSVDNVEVHALDEKTLEVVLEEPTPYFDQLTSFFTYYPVNKKIVEKNSNWATNSGEDYVSNGAFTLSSWKHDDSIQLKKNDNYWGKDTVDLDEVTIKMIEEESTANKMFEAGELDFLGAPFQLVPLDAVEGYKASNQLKTPKYAATYFLRVGVTKEFVSNKNIRKALALAIDRDNIVTNIVKSGQTVATGFIPPTIDGFESNSGYFKDNDVEEAKKYLKLGMEELGIENASDITIDINISSSEMNDAIAQVIQEDWTKNLGIKAAISNSELKVFLDKISSLDYSGVASSTWIADYLDGYTFLEIFNSKTNGNNRTGWENEEYTSLLNASNKEQNPEKRLDILKEAEALLMDEMPIIPVFYSTSTNIVKDYVSDMQSNALGELYLKEVKVDRK